MSQHPRVRKTQDKQWGKKIGVDCKSKKRGSPLGVPDRNFTIKSRRKIGSSSTRTCTPGPLLAPGFSVVLVPEIRLGAEMASDITV